MGIVCIFNKKDIKVTFIKERKKEKQRKRDTNEYRIKEENRTNLS